MRLHICAVGRMKPGPERAIFDDYVARAERAGRQMGLGPIALREVEIKGRSDKAAEGTHLLRAIPENAVLCVLDERGRTLTSPKFATWMAEIRDNGAGDLCFAIGGADGLADNVLDRAQMTLSFGKMVWPHMLARVMLSEQIYRAISILSGSPYHRE